MTDGWVQGRLSGPGKWKEHSTISKIIPSLIMVESVYHPEIISLGVHSWLSHSSKSDLVILLPTFLIIIFTWGDSLLVYDPLGRVSVHAT